MHPFEFVLAIIALSCAYRLGRFWVLHKANRPAVDETANDELLKRLGAAEERIKVLERIVTDDRFELKQQFRDLGSR